MEHATIQFRELLVNEQGVAVDGEGDSMRSRAFFDLVHPEGTYTGLSARIKQAAGSSFEGDPLEVGPVEPDVGLRVWNQLAFADCVEQYYRGLVGGSSSGGVYIEPGSVTNGTMTNMRIVTPAQCVIHLPER